MRRRGEGADDDLGAWHLNRLKISVFSEEQESYLKLWILIAKYSSANAIGGLPFLCIQSKIQREQVKIIERGAEGYKFKRT